MLKQQRRQQPEQRLAGVGRWPLTDHHTADSLSLDREEPGGGAVGQRARTFTSVTNVTILDIAPVHIGDHVMIGPNTLISTVNHPMTPMGRRRHLGVARPVTIGNDVWLGGNVTILPGVTIGNNVVVAAGAVVTKDVPDNSLVGGVPAQVLRELENDVDEAAL